MKRLLVLVLTAFCLQASADDKTLNKKPYGTLTKENVPLNALDIRDTHKQDIQKLLKDYDLKQVKVVTASDDYWYYSLQSRDGLYGVADQQGQIIVQPIYTTCYYCPSMPNLKSSILVPIEQENSKANVLGAMPVYTPATQGAFLVNKDEVYDILNLHGTTVKHDIGGKPSYIGYYLMTGVEQENLIMTYRDDSIPQLTMCSADTKPIRVITTDGREVTLPSPTWEDGVQRIVIEEPFIEACTVEETTTKGSLHINSDHPDARIKVDGKVVGNVPMTLELVGDHNIVVEDDYNNFFREAEHITITPNDKLQRYYNLQAMPMKTNLFLLAQYGISTRSIGLMAAVCKRWGGYVKALMWGAGEKHDLGNGGEPQYAASPDYMSIEKLANRYSLSLSAGTMYKVNQYIYPYIGVGYASYSPGRYKPFDYYPSHIRGMVLDLGVMANWRKLALSIGWSPMIAIGNKQGLKSYGDWHIGVGIKIHKNRKRK